MDERFNEIKKETLKYTQVAMKKNVKPNKTNSSNLFPKKYYECGKRIKYYEQ